MRWDALFDDLEAQLARQDADDLHAEVAERTRAERATTALADRLLAHLGARLSLTLPHGAVAGAVTDVAPQWVVLADERGRVLVPTASVVAVTGLGRPVAPEPGTVLRRLGLGHVLRGLARDRAPVAVHAGASTLTGTIDRVGADHLDLALHAPGEVRRASAVSGVAAVAFAHLEQVRGRAD